MISLDQVSTLLTNHVDRVLDSTVRNDRNDRSINRTEILDAMDAKLGVDGTLFDVLRQASSTTGVEYYLASFQNGSSHFFIQIERRIPRVLFDDDILEAFTMEE